MTNVLKRIAAMLAVVVAMVGGVVVTAAPASAAVYYCDAQRTATTYGLINSNLSSSIWRCYQNEGRYYYSATRALQISYNHCYASRYPGGLPSGRTQLVTDGAYGAETKGAVKNIQDRHGLSKDGNYGPQTAAKFRVLQSNTGRCVFNNP